MPPSATNPRAKKRESPTYIPMGIEAMLLVRMRPGVRRELRHAHRLVFPKPIPVSAGKFMSTCASIGADVVAGEHYDDGGRWTGEGIQLMPTAIQEAERRAAKTIRTQLAEAYRHAYRGLPSPGFGAFVGFCAAVGMDVMRRTYLPAPATPAKGAP